MAMQLGDLASLVEGRLNGNAEVPCTGANPPREATATEITMLDDPSRLDTLKDSLATAVVTRSEIDLRSIGMDNASQIIVDNPHKAFAKIVSTFRPPVECKVPSQGIDSTAVIHDSAEVHPTATIGMGVSIGARTRIMPGVSVGPFTQVGEDCLLHANVTLYEYTTLADRVIIHAGTVIGCTGFGYRQEGGRHLPTAQLGYVAIESDVELGASVTIDRGTYGATRIGEGTKIDNQVMIGHNCRIGKHNLLCSQVGIAGSCTTGDYVILAGQVGLKDHIELGDGTIVGAQAGVMDNCPGNEVYLGSPATPQRDQMQIMAVQRKLPEMRREIKKLRRELARLEEQQNSTESGPIESKATSEDKRAA
ncbi:MAG: UDP-3-O-(3-hydroxymyristoyl)glucosamine N-acyltransferase [Planctomycetaceae bacterium]|nr:UDP-3-O-(3-hydroxymyristoyl)glucosamine N-acyltransferase [Planctomycetaceae bacterium]